MSFVCNLCGGWSEYTGNKLTVHPDFPVGQRQTATICNDCLDALEKSNEENGCVWCGDASGLFTVWELIGISPMGGRLEPGDRISTLCPDCWSQARGEYPADFNADLKNKVREESDCECVECGMPQGAHKDEFGQKLHVHHKDGDKRNNKLKNLIALCARCHGSK